MMGWVLELKDQTEFWLALTRREARITCTFKFWEVKTATLQRNKRLV